MEDDKICQVGTNLQKKNTVIRNVANTHAEVLAAHEKYANLAPGALDAMLMRASCYKFRYIISNPPFGIDRELLAGC